MKSTGSKGCGEDKKDIFVLDFAYVYTYINIHMYASRY